MVVETVAYNVASPAWGQHSAQPSIRQISGSQVTASKVSSLQCVLCGNVAAGWEVIEPLQLEITRDEAGYYVVTDAMYFTYGTGETIPEALENYRASLVAEMQILQRDEESLAPPLMDELRLLRAHLRQR